MEDIPARTDSEFDAVDDRRTGKDSSETVWTYRGYRLKTSEFTTAMIHLFRAEVQRANVWRQRLDTTTNWAVVSTGAVITYAFSGTQGHHALIILSFLLVAIFLSFEARRYRYYELWSYRVRLMETNFFGNMLVPPFTPNPEWAVHLSETLKQPQFTVTMLEAFGRRLRRNYLAIFTVLLLSWIGKLWLHPTNAESLEEMIQRASLGVIPGSAVWMIIFAFWIAMLLLAAWTIRFHDTSGEVLTRKRQVPEKIKEISLSKKKDRPPVLSRPTKSEPQAMALIITDKPEEVAKVLMKEMGRGITGLEGKGMYSGQAHHVLLVALRAVEITRLKALVGKVDGKAFVVILSANEVLGKGFVPLSEAPS
jgi:uncharacterized membrane protein